MNSENGNTVATKLHKTSNQEIWRETLHNNFF